MMLAPRLKHFVGQFTLDMKKLWGKHIMLIIIQKNLTIPQMMERPAILKAISYGPHQIASFKAFFDFFRKHDETFLRRWMEECLEKFTTMSSSTLHYVLWLLNQESLYNRFIHFILP